MIRDWEAFRRASVNWDFLGSCFGNSGIRVSDIDGFVERNGHVLVLEAKGPDVGIPTGQRRAFRVLAQTPNFTVLVLWGRNTDDGVYSVAHMMAWGTDRRAASNGDVVAFVREWYAIADRQPRAAPSESNAVDPEEAA